MSGAGRDLIDRILSAGLSVEMFFDDFALLFVYVFRRHEAAHEGKRIQVVFRPITLPGLQTELQPRSTQSPRTAPIFRSPVGTFSPSKAIVTFFLSALMFDRMEPAPICA